jgi:monooxygenase
MADQHTVSPPTPTARRARADHVDIVIVGAGLSGIGAAHHLQQRLPGKSYTILEGRERMGGTWDLFRYPGIRSDSDMHTLGYAFRPWREAKAIADGGSILRYIQSTAAESGIKQHIRYQHRVLRALWSSETATWTVDAEHGPAREPVQLTCNFLMMCSGYYSYESGHTPKFENSEAFAGQLVHPQKWPEDLDYRGKRVVVIGSGATAVTLVPAMAETAAHVTMLQRSPTYIMSMPDEDRIATALRRYLPANAAYQATRVKNVVMQTALYQLSRRRPELVKRLLRRHLRQQLGPDFDIDTHFTPRYNPWDERMCLVPNGDLFKALRRGHASVVTDQIARFTANGIELQSGKHLDADIIVTATGLTMKFLGGLDLVVDGRKLKGPDLINYKGVMFGDVPNMVGVLGYTNASWTLKADLASTYACRLLEHMDKHGHDICAPRTDPSVERVPFLDLKSGYVRRAADLLPKQGATAPWRLRQNYFLDRITLQHGKLEDGVMTFSRSRLGSKRAAPAAAPIAAPDGARSVA